MFIVVELLDVVLLGLLDISVDLGLDVVMGVVMEVVLEVMVEEVLVEAVDEVDGIVEVEDDPKQSHSSGTDSMTGLYRSSSRKKLRSCVSLTISSLKTYFP